MRLLQAMFFFFIFAACFEGLVVAQQSVLIDANGALEGLNLKANTFKKRIPSKNRLAVEVADDGSIDERPQQVSFADAGGRHDMNSSGLFFRKPVHRWRHRRHAARGQHSNMLMASMFLDRIQYRLVYPKHRQLVLRLKKQSVYRGDPYNSIWSSRLIWAFWIFIFLGCCLSAMMIILKSGGGAEQDEDQARVSGGSGDEQTRPSEKVLSHSCQPLQEDLYGMAIAALIRDSHRLVLRTELPLLRITRLAMTFMVLIFTVTLQLFLLKEMFWLVTTSTTREAREDYDKYEIWMYGNDTTKMTKTSAGYHRGTDGNFNATLFDTLDDDLKKDICQVPFSQPTFFLCLLLCWTTVCMVEVRTAVDLAVNLMITTPTIDSMSDSLQETVEQGDEAVIVVGLTRNIKMVAGLCILLPRAAVAGFLWWLGARWLSGTMGFSDVLQNAVALQFIVLLKDLLYMAVVPHHNKRDTRNTLIQPSIVGKSPSVSIFIGEFLWGVASITLVLLYIEVFQQVLPEYRWDIHDACNPYLGNIEDAVLSTGTHISNVTAQITNVTDQIASVNVSAHADKIKAVVPGAHIVSSVVPGAGGK